MPCEIAVESLRPSSSAFLPDANAIRIAAPIAASSHRRRGGQAPRVEKDEGGDRDRDREGAAAREGEERGQRHHRKRRGGDRLHDEASGAHRGREHQGDPDRDQCGERVPVVERIAEPRLDVVEKARGLDLGEELRVQAGEEREQGDDADRRGDRVDGAAHCQRAPLDGDREREDPDERGDACELGDAALARFRPRDPEPGPQRERRQQPEGDPGCAADPGQRQEPDERAERDRPPADHPDLAVDDGVVAAARKRQIDDQQERQPVADRGHPPVPAGGLGARRGSRRRLGAGRHHRGLSVSIRVS